MGSPEVAETLRKFYDSLLSAGDDPNNPPSDEEKIDKVISWIAQAIEKEAIEAYKHEKKIEDMQNTEEEAKTQYGLVE